MNKFRLMLCVAALCVGLTSCSNADSSTAEVTTPAGQTTTTTTTTTESEPVVEQTTTTTTTSAEQSVTTTTTTTTTQSEPTTTTTTPEEETTTTTTAETTKPKVTTTTKKPVTTTKATTTTTKKTTTTTTTTTKKVDEPPKDGVVMYSCGITMRKKPKTGASQILIEDIPIDKQITVIGDIISNEYGNWYNIYYDGQYGYCDINGLSSLPYSRWDEELCNLINDYRESLGLEKLEIDQRLMKAADIRSKECDELGCLDHTRPDGTSCFTVFAEVGITDERCLGVENLGSGGCPPIVQFNAWKQSNGHNKNMTYANSVAMGVGYVDGGAWVFLARTAETTE